HLYYSLSFLHTSRAYPALHSFPTRRSSDLKQSRFPLLLGRERKRRSGPDELRRALLWNGWHGGPSCRVVLVVVHQDHSVACVRRSEEHTSELQSRFDLVCRLLLEKKKINSN